MPLESLSFRRVIRYRVSPLSPAPAIRPENDRIRLAARTPVNTGFISILRLPRRTENPTPRESIQGRARDIQGA